MRIILQYLLLVGLLGTVGLAKLSAQTVVVGPFLGRDIEIPDSGEVRAVAYPQTGARYRWSNDWKTSTIFVQNPGWYWVDVEIDNVVVRDSIHFHAGPRCFDLPNMFTPNSEVYDCLRLQSNCELDTMHFRVFDRWGREVYATGKQGECWNGQSENNPLPDGVYYYLIEWAIPDGLMRMRTGFITIYR